MPDLATMLQMLGEERKYLTYIILSQFTHCTLASGTYRKHLGTLNQRTNLYPNRLFHPRVVL